MLVACTLRVLTLWVVSSRRESRPDKMGAALYTGPTKIWTTEDDKILVLKLSLLRANSKDEVNMVKISKIWYVFSGARFSLRLGTFEKC